VRDAYGEDVLADPAGHRRAVPTVTAAPGLLVEVPDGFVGRVTGCSGGTVTLRDRRGRERHFSLHPAGFLVDDRRVTLVPPTPSAPAAPAPLAGVSNSGSIAVPDARARVARASRILVEGVHDAELLEQVWGHDLRVEGIVVEVLHGADDLGSVVRTFSPGPTRRLGVLLDHLVPGSKEARIAASVRDPHVLVTGHPFVDVWAAVRPEALGIDAWPDVPHGEPWKEGVARRLGISDPQQLWRHVRASVTTWQDLDRALIRAVEELVDFVSVEPTSTS
jgi:hypothetical protein